MQLLEMVNMMMSILWQGTIYNMRGYIIKNKLTIGENNSSKNYE